MSNENTTVVLTPEALAAHSRAVYDRALNNEPTFTLLARDPSAPDMVRQWAYARRRSIAHGLHPESDTAKVDMALAQANEMEVWRHKNDGKWRA